MVELKLTYFDVRARAEVTRIMLTYAGRKFTDVRLKHEDWPPIKPTMPLGSLPVLELDGGKTQLCQSLAIARYVAREIGVAGDTSLEQAQVDMITTTVDEILTSLGDCYMEKDETKKAEKEKKQKEVLVPTALKFLEKCLENNASGGGHFVGKSVTLADFMTWHILEYLVNDSEDALDTYPKVKANRELVSKLPKFAEYQKNRPTTPY